MAKTKFNNEEGEFQPVENPTAEQTAGNASAKVEDRSAEEIVITSNTKKVRIHTVEEVNCLVACKPYNLKKDKDYQVPSDVAAILCYAKKAYRL